MSSEYLQIRDLRVEFDGFHAVDGVDLTLMQGDLRFLIGAQRRRQDDHHRRDHRTGEIDRLHSEVGRGTVGKKVHQIARLGIGRTFQTASVFEELTVLQNLDIAAGAGRLGGRCCAGARPEFPTRSPRHWRRSAWPITVRRRPAYWHTARNNGLKLECCWCRTHLYCSLDEPVAGMSGEEREETGQLLRRIGGERIVVVVEHDMDFMRSFATSVSVLARGKVIAEGSVAQVQANPKVQEVYLGTASAVGADISVEGE